ncbi:MAG TPA: hypothetical protein VFU20_00495 [Sphingomicrobium sp.]|nr:hypothetical protein [Sphingomicrobium sp.]
MLDEQRPSLDAIFGPDSYVIEETSPYSAILKTAIADFEFSDDPRDFVSASITSVPAVDLIQSPLDIWMRFLDEEIPAQRRSDPYQEQLANELKWIAVIVERILKDADRRREAASFVNGYNRAYNDWASGKGSWAEPDFND